MDEFLNKCGLLYKSALTGDWETAEKVIDDDQDVVYASVTEGGETALHIAVAGKHTDFVEKLISKMKYLGIKNREGDTAFHFAAAEGNLQIVMLLVEANNQLPTICGQDGVKPIYLAASLGHREIVNFLYSSDFRAWPIQERARILTACIASGLFDVALKMIIEDNKLLITEDADNDTTLDVLVRMSSEFADDNEKPKRICSCKKLLKSILSILFQTKDVEISNLKSNCSVLALEAAKLGNMEFLVILLQKFPHLIWTTDTHKRSIFHFAASNRHLGIFNLIYEVDSNRSFLTSKMDQDDNNMLHLVAKLAPQNELDKVSNAALQMQRELLWFKEVKAIVPPSYVNMKNKNGETPLDIFAKEHATLMVEGKRWMRDTATASMLVSTLIATVVFTSIFTPPGGLIRIMYRKSYMKVFYMSEAIAFFSSSTSILMFLSIFTSRYAQKDFLHSLPLKLMIGSTTLILSLGAMDLAFCTGSFWLYYDEFYWTDFLLLAPNFVMYLRLTQKWHYVICSRYDARNMFGSQNRLFWLEEK